MKVDILPFLSKLNISGLNELLTNLNVGDIIKAQILEINTNDILLKLLDGTTFKASKMADLEVNAGDFVKFTVKEKTQNQIILETVKPKSNNSKQKEIELSLKELDIKANNKNVEIATAIKSSNLSLNKETFDKIFNFLTKIKELTPEKAAFFLANNINIEPKKVEALNNIIDKKFAIGTKLQEILESVAILISKNDEVEVNKNKDIIEKVTNKDNKEVITSNEKEHIIKEAIIREAIIREAIIKKLPQVNSDLKQQILNYILDNKDISENNLSKEIEKFVDTLPLDITLPKQVFLKQLKKQLCDVILDIFKNLDKETDINNQTHAIALKRAVDKLYTKVDSKLDNNFDVKEMYKDIYKNLEDIKKNITLKAPEAEQLKIKIEETQSNLKFINEINSNGTSYIQIPIKINENNTTGELYFINGNKKKKKIDKDNVTIFICLNTQNLGQIDSLITVKNKNISINLRIESQEIIDFVKKNYNELYFRMLDKGYKLSNVSYNIIHGEVNVLNINNFLQKQDSNSFKTIDYKV